jgi:hypothetical protein
MGKTCGHVEDKSYDKEKQKLFPVHLFPSLNVVIVSYSLRKETGSASFMFKQNSTAI